MDDSLTALLAKIDACELCASHLPLGPRPIIRAHPDARVLIIGQAPGTRVHNTGIPWNDPSGDRLRAWMDVDSDTFYDAKCMAIMPMGLCYPGKGKSGDLPPRPECAPQWHDAVLQHLPNLQLTLLIGQYAQRYYLPKPGKTLTETVRGWPSLGNDILPLPHPSPRNQLWLKKNPWFEQSVIPELRRRVSAQL